MAELAKPLIAFDQISRAEDDPSFWEGMGATYGYSWRPVFGAMYSGSFQEDENFNVLNYLTDEDLDSSDDVPYYAMARSEEHLNFLRSHLGKMEENRALMSRTGWTPFLLASILDPINLVSLPFRGATMAEKTWSGVKYGLLLGVGTEAIRAPFDPNATLAETGLNITGSTFLLGAMGGIVGSFSGRATKNFAEEQNQVNASIGQKVNPNEAFNYKNNWFVNSPFFKALPSPMKTILQGNFPQSTKKLMTLIGADGGLATMMNKAGQGISSVFMRSVTYMGDYAVHSQSLKNIYDKFLRQEGIRLRWGKFNSSFKEFAERLSKERMLREADPNRPRLTNAEEEFINEIDIFYTKYGVDMLDNGLLATRDSITKGIARMQQKITDLQTQLRSETNVRAKKQIRKMLGKQKAKLKDAEDLLALDYNPQFRGTYFPRYFNVDAIANNLDEFKSILRTWYTNNPIGTQTAESIEKSVEETVNKILNKSPIDDDFMGAGLSKHLRHRELDIPNHLLMDFIETNPLDVALYYMMRTGSKIEFQNTFGGRSIDDLMDDEHLSMIRHGNDDATIATAKANIYHMYDRVVGQAIHNPDAWNRRIARALTDYTAYVFLGRAGLSSVPELGAIILQHASKQGPLGLENLGSTLRALADFKALGLSAKEVQIVGEALDMYLGVAHNRMYEDHLRSPFMKGISKINETGKKWFYTLNGLAPITQATKKIAGILGQHTLIDRSIRLVNGTLDQEGIELLARYGITIRDARKIKALVDDGTIQTSESGLLYLANTTAWKNQKLMRKFRGALNLMTRNTIINATPADKPMIIDGVVYAKMNPVLKAMGYKADKRVSVGDAELVRIEQGMMAFPFQFWNYTIGATNKILAGGFDRERTGKIAGFTVMLALGYATLYAKNPTSFGYMDWEDQLLRSIDQTGITGIYSDLFYTGLHARHRMDNLKSKETIIQPKYKIEPSPISSTLESVAEFAGATPSAVFDIADTAGHFIHGETKEGLSQACRLMPFSSLYGIRNICGAVDSTRTRGRF